MSMHLLIISREWPGHVLGGISYHLDNLYNEIADQGHEITVITGTCPEATKELTDDPPPTNAIHTVPFGYRKGYYMLFPLALRRFIKTLNFEPFDACITHTGVPFKIPLPTISKRHDCYWATKKYIRDGLSGIDAIGDLAMTPFRRIVDKRSLAAADHLLYNSDLCQEAWESTYTIQTSSAVSYNGVDIDVFYRDRSEENDRYILFVGGSERKGLSRVIEFARYSNKPIYIVGPETVSADNVKALGRLSSSELRRVYSDADVTIHPAGWEAFGNVILESIACGTPVVASNNCGAIEPLPASVCVVTENIKRGVVEAQQLQSEDCIAAARQLSWETTARETLEAISAVSSL